MRTIALRTIAPDKTLPSLGKILFYLSFPFGFMGFVLPIYGKEIGASATEIGLLFSVFSLMTLVLRPMVGYLLDHVGRRVFVIAGVVLYTLTMLVFAMVENYTGILIARALQGVASASLWLASYAVVSDLSAAEKRGENYGRVQQSSNAGALFGATAGFVILMALKDTIAGTKAAFSVYTVVVAATLFWALRLPETLAGKGGSGGRPDGGAAAAGGAAPPAEKRVRGPRGLFSRKYFAVLGVVLFTSIGNGMLAPLMMIYIMEKMGTDVIQLGAAYVPAAIVWSVLPARAGKFADRHGRRPFMLLGLGASAAVAALIPSLPSLWYLIALWVAEAAALSMAIPAEQALISDLTDARLRGQAYGFYDMTANLGFSLGPALGGLVFEKVGHAAPFYLDSVILLLAAMVVIVALGGVPKPAPSMGSAPSTGPAPAVEPAVEASLPRQAAPERTAGGE